MLGGTAGVTRELSKCIFCFSLEVTSLQGLTAENHCSHREQKEEGVRVLFLKTWCPWSDVPVGFTQQLNVGFLVSASSSVRWQTQLLALLACNVFDHLRFSWNTLSFL